MVTFAEAETFGYILKARRKSAGLSQASLAASANTTTRNISNLETGKITPTRTMIKRLSRALESNAQSYSELLRAGGFAYDSYTDEQAEEYQQAVQVAVDLLLDRHGPYPALVLNRQYDIIQVNDSFRQGLQFLQGAMDKPLALPISLFDVLFGLPMFNDIFMEQEKTARFLIQRVHREQLNNQFSTDLLSGIQARLPHLPKHWWDFDPDYQPSPNLRTDLRIRGEVYETIGVLQSIGSPHDVGGNAVRVILSYPINQAAKALFATWQQKLA